MGMSHILPPHRVVHLARNGSWRDRFTACAAGKTSGKGNRSTRAKTLLKYIQIVPWGLELTAPVSRCWLTFNWTMQNLHGVLGACFTWGSHQAAPALVPLLFPSPAPQQHWECCKSRAGLAALPWLRSPRSSPALLVQQLHLQERLWELQVLQEGDSGILLFQGGLVCRAALNRSLGKSSKSRVPKGTHRGCTHSSRRLC